MADIKTFKDIKSVFLFATNYFYLLNSLRNQMKQDQREKLVKELTVALILLTSWQEKTITGEPVFRAWKGYDFDVLDRLQEAGFIDSSKTAKSLYLTKEGVIHAESVVGKLAVCIE
jgi:hypothetical protein